MQKEPAKAGSFFDGRGKMMGSGLWRRLCRSINLAMPEGLRWQVSLVSSAPRGRYHIGADRALLGKLNENRGKSDASRRIYDGIEAAAFPAIPIEPAFSIAPSSHSPHSLNLQFLKKSVKRPSFYGIIIVTDEKTQVWSI